MTNRSTSSSSRSGSIARWVLATLSLLFVAGALGQFFLVGLSMFEDGSRWQDHKTLGHMIGLIPYMLWIPAVLGRVGRGLIFGTLMLFVLYMAQYGFINAGTGVMNALHPLNGSILLLLGVWIANRSISVARTPVARRSRNLPTNSLTEEAA